MKHNILLWGWEEQDQVSAVDKFSAETEHVISLWFTNSNNGTHSYKDFFYKQPKQSDFHYTITPHKLTYKELSVFNNLFSRENRSKGEDYHEIKNIANMYFHKILDLCIGLNISKALFSIIPITGFDYLAYIACKRLNIDTVICFQAPLEENLFFYSRKISDFGNFVTIQNSHNILNYPITWGFKKDIWYMNDPKEISNKDRSPTKQFVKEVYRYVFRDGSNPMKSSGVVQNFSQAKEFRKNYNKYAKQITVNNLPEKFVYFPLHLNPELTINTLGGKYSDQLDAIESLSEIIPKDWTIIVKENPKQGSHQRGGNFFNRLFSLNNTLYASKETSTYLLLEYCQFTGTVTGTVGWESITGLKPVLTFGYAWYNTLPGVIQYRNNITIDEIMETKIHKKDLQKEYNILMSKAHLGIMDAGYIKAFNNYSKKKNVEHLLSFIKKVCNEKIC